MTILLNWGCWIDVPKATEIKTLKEWGHADLNIEIESENGRYVLEVTNSVFWGTSMVRSLRSNLILVY